MKKVFLFTAALVMIAALGVSAQTKPAGQQATATKQTKAVPLYAIGSLMTGRTIKAEAAGKRFTYQLTSASIVAGKIQFTGVVNNAPAKKVMATLVSTTARSANPWPSATANGTERRPAQRSNTKPEEQRPQGEVNEQTQSLFSAAGGGTGCELLYLKMKTPLQPQPLQVGVVLSHQDNKLGNDINQAVCFVVWALQNKQNSDQPLAQLNKLLSQGK